MGTLLFPGLGPGLGSTINPFDPDYNTKVLIQKNQQAADKYNADEAAKYISRARELKEENIGQAAAKLPLFVMTPPPFKHVLTADGLGIVDSPEPVAAIISVVPDPPVINDHAPQQNVFPVSATLAANGTDRLIQMVTILYFEMQAIKQKLGV